MENPYTPPLTDETVSSELVGSKIAQRICLGVSIIAILIFFFVALILIPQAMRLGDESQNPNLPPRLQGASGLRSMAFASWVGGATALGGIALNVVAIMLSRRGKIGFAILAVVLSIVSMVVVAVTFRPS